MKWKVIVSEPAKKQFTKLPDQIARRILDFLRALETRDNPRTRAKALVGEKNKWRYRVGDYRIICEIRDRELVVLVLEIGNRKNIYR